MRHARPGRGVLLLSVLAGCAARPPRIPYAGGLDGFLGTHPPAAGQEIRADEIGRTATASYHVVQVHGSEKPHRHVAHDLTVFVLRGHGVFTRGADRVVLRAGDSVVIPRGEPHWFASDGDAGAVSLAVFTPPLDAPDTVPAEAR